MEVPRGIFGVKPPNLEDAGLEDTALNPEGIQEAFRIAALKVGGAATGILNKSLPHDEEDKGCADTPGVCAELGDVLVGDELPDQAKQACVETQAGGLIEEGRDKVVDTSIDKVEDQVLVPNDGESVLGESGCIKSGDKDAIEEQATEKSSERDEEVKDEVPSLVEAAI